MRCLNIFFYEWKHLFRNPFKIIALLLFILAGIYGLHNGADLYKKQRAEIERLNQKAKAEQEIILAYFDKGEQGPTNRPWVDISTPFWSIRYVPSYFYKKPSPAIVYNIGQAEQYGFYKKISMYSSPYDTDMAKEIVNPERIQSGTLDFAFVVLFLMPLLLLVLLYNLKAQEADEGFLNLVFVQTGTKNWWILSRTLFYSMLLLVVLLGLLFYGSFLTGVFNAGSIFWVVFREISIYLLFWVGIYFIILKCSKSIISNTLLMIGTWLFFAFIIPAAIHQWISIEKPTSLMVDLIDVKRDKTDEIYEQSNSDTDKQIIELYPALKQTKIAHDTIGIVKTRRASKIALVNTAMKMAIFEFESENKSRNKLVETTYWINPITYFQNKLNHSSKTHYDDYHTYREDIQYLIDKRIETMVLDIWNDVKVDKSKYLNYNKLFALY